MVGVPQDVPRLPRRIPGEVLARPGGVRVSLELPRGTVDLVEETVVARVARRGVRATLPHRDAVPPVTRPHVVDEPLFLLERREDDLRVDATRLRHLVDNARGALARAARVGATHRVGRRRARRVVPVLQTGVSGPAGRNHFLQEGLDLRFGHRGLVEEDGVADDVAGLELRQIGGLDGVADRGLRVEGRLDVQRGRSIGDRRLLHR